MRPISVWYHCKISGPGIPDADAALEIVSEQMEALNKSGLAGAASEIHIHLNGHGADEILVAQMVPEKSTMLDNGPGSVSELPTLSSMRSWLPSHPNWAVCYHHSKGVTQKEWGRRDPGFKAFHRRTMEKYVIWGWRKCLADLERGYEAVGCNLVHPVKRNCLPGRFFAGNFWWATSDYLSTLPNIPDNCSRFDNVTERCVAEGWIGSSPRADVRFMDYERPELYGL